MLSLTKVRWKTTSQNLPFEWICSFSRIMDTTVTEKSRKMIVPNTPAMLAIADHGTDPMGASGEVSGRRGKGRGGDEVG